MCMKTEDRISIVKFTRSNLTPYGISFLILSVFKEEKSRIIYFEKIKLLKVGLKINVLDKSRSYTDNHEDLENKIQFWFNMELNNHISNFHETNDMQSFGEGLSYLLRVEFKDEGPGMLHHIGNFNNYDALLDIESYTINLELKTLVRQLINNYDYFGKIKYE